MKKETKLIAEFMGFTDEAFERVNLLTLKYNTSWDWLMRVVEKIEDMGCEVVMNNEECTISGANDYYAESIGKSRRDAT